MAEDSQAPTQAGTVIAPGGTAMPPSPPEKSPQSPELPESQGTDAPTPVSTNAPVSPYAIESAASANANDKDAITWTASEYIAHQKSAGWYGLLALAVAVVAGIIFFFTRDVISTGVVILGGIALGFYGARQPHQKQYRLDASGLSVGQRHYDFAQFRYFSIVEEGAFSSIVFMPLKRFAPLTSIYYAPEDEETIIDLLSLVLPESEFKRDPIDRFMYRIRF